MRRISNSGRALLLVLGAAVVVIPTVALLHQAGQAPVAAAAQAERAASSPTGPVVPVGMTRDPKTGLLLANDHISFTPMQPAPTLAPPTITATAGIAVDIDSDKILWSRNPHQALPPASTTKVMTSLVVLDNYSPEQPITITKSALTQAADESRMGLSTGETLTVEELMEGMLLVSANDAATTLATDTVGLQRFVQTMNDQEAALGLHDSHFGTPVGLDTPGHVISSYDLAAIATVDVDYFPLFRQIVSTSQIVLPQTAQHKEYWLDNENQLLDMLPGAVGIKPGYTGNAGYCLVGEAVRDGHRIVTVLMNAPYVYSQSAELLSWAFKVDTTLPNATVVPTQSPAVPSHSASETDAPPASPPAPTVAMVPPRLAPREQSAA